MHRLRTRLHGLLVPDADGPQLVGAKAALPGPLRALATGRTTIVVSHDPHVLARADRVVRIEDGRIVAPPAEGSAAAAEPAPPAVGPSR